MHHGIGAATLTLVAASLLGGCLIGPPREMVHGDWRLQRDRPVVLDPDWEYKGEHFEQAVYADAKKSEERDATPEDDLDDPEGT